jgi:hypothetical protein
MSSESTIINNTNNSIGFSSFEGINKNLNSKNPQVKTKKNLDTILEKKGENKYITNSKILKKIKIETGKNDFCKDSLCKNEEKVQVKNTNTKILLPNEKEKKNTNITSLNNINNKKILNTKEIKIKQNIAEIAQKTKLDKMAIKKIGKDLGKINKKNDKNLNIKKDYNNYIKENNNEERDKNIIQICSDSLNTNKHSNISKKVFDDEDMKIQKDKRETKKEKNLTSSKKNERYQNSSESGSLNLNETLNNLIKKLDAVVTQNQTIITQNQTIITQNQSIITQNQSIITQNQAIMVHLNI